MATTRSDVARLAGVSPAVVSYVLNGGPRPVARGTRERVEAAIRQLDYRPNAIASALRGGTTQSLGLLTPDQRNPYYAELVEAVERRFDDQGYLVLTGSTNHDRAREEKYLRTFVDRRVDALVLSAGVSLARSAPADMDGVPVVALEILADGEGFSQVGWDEVADAATAVEHLQHHGHRLIGCVAGPPWVSVEEARMQGWRAQQAVEGSPSGDELTAVAEASEAGGNSAALLLLTRHGRPWAVHGRRPTALFVASDVQAIGAVYACHELGLRVPEDVAVVSMGGTRAAAYAIPPLTTLRQDVEHVATLTAAHLIRRITEPGTAPLTHRMRGNLVLGRSCGCRL